MNPFKTFNNILKIYINNKAIDQLPFRWSEKHRFYHNINHLIDILQNIENDINFKELSTQDKHALCVASFMHDIIYDPKKKDNENKSIKYFINSYISKDKMMMNTICDLIEVTKYRKRPINKLQKIMWDADNAGFKRGYETLSKNEKLIAKEYKQKRIEFLTSNLGLFNSSVDKDLNKLIEYIKQNY